ncbi:hypothetical protein JCM8208_003724 [Rhodotorula glutinis]
MPRTTSYLRFGQRPRTLASPYPLLAGPRLAIRQARLKRGLDKRNLVDLGRLQLHPWLVRASQLDYQKLMATPLALDAVVFATSLPITSADRRGDSPPPRPLKRKADDSDGTFVASMTLPEKRCRLTKEQYIYRIASGYDRKAPSEEEVEQKKLEVALARYHRLCVIDRILKAQKEEQAARTAAIVLADESDEHEAAPQAVEPAKKKSSPFASTSTRRSTEELFPDDEYVPDNLADKYATPAEIRRSGRIAARRERMGLDAWVDLSDSDDTGVSDEDNGVDELGPLSDSDDEDIKPVVIRSTQPERRKKRKTHEEPIVLSDDDEPAAPVNKRARTSSLKPQSVNGK